MKWTIRKNHGREEVAGPETGWTEVIPAAHLKALEDRLRSEVERMRSEGHLAYADRLEAILEGT